MPGSGSGSDGLAGSGSGTGSGIAGKRCGGSCMAGVYSHPRRVGRGSGLGGPGRRMERMEMQQAATDATGSASTTGHTPGYFHVLAKPTGAVCNLDCSYCFFLSKEALYPESDFRMADDLLETYIRQLVESQPQSVTIAWQGGEPTLMGLDFFRRSVTLVEKYRKPGQRVEHSIQTNGTRLDDAWCEFFKQHGFLVGLSVDGPRQLHRSEEHT